MLGNPTLSILVNRFEYGPDAALSFRSLSFALLLLSSLAPAALPTGQLSQKPLQFPLEAVLVDPARDPCGEQFVVYLGEQAGMTGAWRNAEVSVVQFVSFKYIAGMA